MWLYMLAAFVGVGTYTGSGWWGLAAAAVVYPIAVQFHPWARCWWPWCKGDPKTRSEDGRFWRYCPICRGSGRRKRLLAVWNGWSK